jgi:cell wall-associated NlpC family hydrolase
MKQRPTSPRRALLVTGALFSILPLTIPRTPLLAQGPGLFDFFAARKDSPNDPLFAGLSITGFSGVWGFRASGGLNFNSGDNSSSQNQPYQYRCNRSQCYYYGGNYSYNDYGLPVGVGGWTVDADLILAPFRGLPIAKSLLLGFSPYAFIGIGGVGVNPANAPDSSHATWSYGVGVHHELLGWLGLSAEARSRRSLHSDSVIAIGTSRNWEFRAGLSISFGAHHDAIATTATGVIMPVEASELDHFETAESAARITARVLDRAEGLVETLYLSGGTNPNEGFDAAGFVQYVFAEEGVSLPRTAHEIAELGETISTRIGTLRPGDLLFFGNDGISIDHVAIYAGHDRIIHATASGGGVRYDVLGEGARGEWFTDHIVTARRIVAEGRGRPNVRRDDSRDEGELDPPDQAPRSNRSRGE